MNAGDLSHCGSLEYLHPVSLPTSLSPAFMQIGEVQRSSAPETYRTARKQGCECYAMKKASNIADKTVQRRLMTLPQSSALWLILSGVFSQIEYFSISS